MTIATVDDIVAGLATQQRPLRFNKQFNLPKGAGTFVSGWLATGWPVAGATPPAYNTSGYTCSKATTGAIGPMSNGAVQLWLAKLTAQSDRQGVIIIYDRLWACSGMGFAAGTYTVTSPGALPARITDNGVGCELWIENYVAMGSASGTLTANYVDPSGAAQSGVLTSVQSAPVVAQMQQVPLATGGNGIKQLTSVVTSATWSSGSFGMTIMKPIAEISLVNANPGAVLDWAQLGLPQIANDACLTAVFFAVDGVAPRVVGTLNLIDK